MRPLYFSRQCLVVFSILPALLLAQSKVPSAATDADIAWSKILEFGRQSLVLQTAPGSDSQSKVSIPLETGYANYAQQIVAKAHEFYLSFPDSSKVPEAKRTEVLAAIQGVQAGDESLRSTVEKAGKEYRGAKAFPIKDRFNVAFLMDSLSQDAKSSTRSRTEVAQSRENLIDGLHQEFGDIDEVSNLYTTFLLTAPMEDANRVATKLSKKSTPAPLRELASVISGRHNMVGKPLNLKLVNLEGKELSMADPSSKATILYVWSYGWKMGSPDEAPKILYDIPDGVRWLFVSLATAPDQLKSAHVAAPFGGTHCAIAGGLNSSEVGALKLSQCPFVYVLNSKGVLTGYGQIDELPALIASTLN